MWEPETVKWDEGVISAAENRSLVVVVGNGISRLSGAPSWPDLFRLPEPKEILRERGIEVEQVLRGGQSLVELAEVLSTDPAAQEGVERRLRDWESSAEPNPVHKILREGLSPLVSGWVTLNFDLLLEKAGIAPNKITHLHGKGSRFKDWVLTEKQYHDHLDRLKAKFDAAAQAGTATLFIGYGHSYDDLDVWLTLRSWRDQQVLGGGRYSLVSETECAGVLKTRLRRLGVLPVTYRTPANPTCLHRQLALVAAILDLCDQARAKAPESRRWYDSELEKQRARNARTTVVIGLAGWNRTFNPDEWPTPKRDNRHAVTYEEPGGPGFIVAKLTAELGFPVAPVTVYGDDPEGEGVHRGLASGGSSEWVDLDHARQVHHAGFRTWQSTVLRVRESGQRYFLDRRVDTGEFERDHYGPNIDTPGVSLEEALRKYSSQTRILYFDKFLRKTVGRVMRDGPPPNCWVVYETGSNGDFANDYQFELNTAARKVHVAIASFRFARDFLTGNGRDKRQKGHLPDADWRSLGGRPKDAPATLTREDLIDAGALAARLRSSSDLLSRYVADRLAARARKELQRSALAGSPSNEWVDSVVQTLQTIIQGESIWDENRFRGLPVSERARTLARSVPKGPKRCQANRRLLEEAFPAEIFPSQREVLADEESRTIREMLNGPHRMRSFATALRAGGDEWLAPLGSLPTRLIVVTLHEYGCLWVDPDSDAWGCERTQPVEPAKAHTASAGDVFRGAFVAALRHCLDIRAPWNVEKKKQLLGHVCRLANDIARLKVLSPTLTQTYSSTGELSKGIFSKAREVFSEWKDEMRVRPRNP